MRFKQIIEDRDDDLVAIDEDGRLWLLCWDRLDGFDRRRMTAEPIVVVKEEP